MKKKLEKKLDLFSEHSRSNFFLNMLRRHKYLKTICNHRKTWLFELAGDRHPKRREQGKNNFKCQNKCKDTKINKVKMTNNKEITF